MCFPDANEPSHSHYFDPAPTSTSAPGSIQVSLPDLSFDLVTDSGVFSRRRLDPGTKILLQEAPELPGEGQILDLGCGFGPIAIVMAMRRPKCSVWAVDVNERALELTRGNARRLGLTNVTATSTESVPDDIRFDAIWSNPPIKIGKSALHRLLDSWMSRLTPTGYAVLVVHKNLGSDSLATWLRSTGWDVERLCSRQGYRLLRVSRR